MISILSLLYIGSTAGAAHHLVSRDMVALCNKPSFIIHGFARVGKPWANWLQSSARILPNQKREKPAALNPAFSRASVAPPVLMYGRDICPPIRLFSNDFHRHGDHSHTLRVQVGNRDGSGRFHAHHVIDLSHMHAIGSVRLFNCRPFSFYKAHL